MARRLLTRSRTSTAIALVAYLAVSVVLFGLPVLRHPGRGYIGTGPDPQLFLWCLAWWPHAILHGLDPFVTHAVWAPVGVDLAWTTSVPGLALALSPVTLAAGPVAAYNVAAIALPALAAWTAFLLCRHITRSTPAALVGGYLFGFSTYMLGHELGHLHLTSVFAIPLVALVIIRFLEGNLDARGAVLRLGPLLALQFSFSTEVFFTLTLAVALALVLAWLTLPARRARLRALLAPLLGAYAGCAVLVSPLLVSALVHFHHGVITPTEGSPADVVGFVAPTGLTRVGARFAQRFEPFLPPVSAEHGQYLGLPTLAIAGWLWWRRRRRQEIRFLALALVAGVVATLGSWLHVRGHRIVPLPWIAVRRLPLFENVIPPRLSVYVALAAAVAVALWLAAPPPSTRVRAAVAVLAVAAILPNTTLDVWHTTPARPSFFVADEYRGCLRPDENVLVLPPPARGDAMLWQAESDFRFRMANGNLSPALPAGLPEPAIAATLNDNDLPAGGTAAVLRLARAQGVTTILVDARDRGWRANLARLRHRVVGGVVLYPVPPQTRACYAETRSP